MKNIHVFLFSSFLMLFISFNANAQTAFTVNEVRQFMSKRGTKWNRNYLAKQRCRQSEGCIEKLTEKK